jgi:micrococcal nuclease
MRPALLVVVALYLAGCGGTKPATPGAAAHSLTGESATVAYVNDGDTLRTTAGQRVRLVQIDAPELHGECFGKAALLALRRFAPAGSHVMLVRDPALDAVDRYGRVLRYVFAAGTNVNLALVREGAVSPYFFRGARGRYAPALIAAADAARGAHRGFWGACPGAKLNPGLGSLTGPA